MSAPSSSPAPGYALFDNSALNHLFGQCPAIDEGARQAATERLARDVASGALSVMVNVALLAEMAGTYFSPKPATRERFDRVAHFIFVAGRGALLQPFDHDGLRRRFALEVQTRGKARHEHLLVTDERREQVADGFLHPNPKALEGLASQARGTKDGFHQGERERKAAVDAELNAKGVRWPDLFRAWSADPQAVIDDWTLDEMNLHPSSYPLPEDRDAWPHPRELPTLWYARAYHVARLKEIGEGRACDERGDIYDGIYFQDSVYADVFITGDEAIIRRARSARIATPRILFTEEWVAEVTSS